MSLQWVPEQYPASGTIGAAGFYKLLGRPQLDPLTVLVRETAQNSWDARDRSGRPVRFAVDARVLSASERETLASRVFHESTQALGPSFSNTLANPNVTGMYISDRNTLGLGGPVLASQADEADVYDWVDFVLNVGTGNTQEHTGGTYGFGKTIAYVVSQVNAVIVHTRTLYRGEIVTRVMACGLGDKFTMDDRKYTGRHWWGVPRDGASAPIEGGEADELAEALGMPSFASDELGTNLLVLEPDFGGRTSRQGMNFIAEAMLWQLWPKTAARGGRPQMELGVSWEGDALEIPTPAERPPLAGFLQAFTELTESADDEVVPPGYRHVKIERLRPALYVGDLATVPMVFQSRQEVDDGHDPLDPDSPSPAAMIPSSGSHHVALMRSPDLVVEYLEGPPAPEGGMEWAGVFKCRDDLDAVFARAEPPTHDTWSPDLLAAGQDRSIVKKALQDIRGALNNRWGSRTSASDPVATTTAAVAERLAHLVGMSSGAGRGRESHPSKSPGPRKNTTSVDFLSAGPLRIESQPATRARVRVSPAQGSSKTRVSVNIGVALDGSVSDSELDPLLSFVSAEYNGVVIDLSGQSTQVDIDTSTPVEVEFVALRSTSSSVLFDFHAEAVDREVTSETRS